MKLSRFQHEARKRMNLNTPKKVRDFKDFCEFWDMQQKPEIQKMSDILNKRMLQLEHR